MMRKKKERVGTVWAVKNDKNEKRVSASTLTIG